MNIRFRDEGKTIYDFLFEFYIKCPKCGEFAYIKSFADEKGSYLFYQKRVLICSNCSFTKSYKRVPGAVGSDFPLWLESKCCGEILWAYNWEHLKYIENYIAATLREDYKSELGYMNTSMLGRLPKWLKDGKNRTEILKCIKNMKNTIPERFVVK